MKTEVKSFFEFYKSVCNDDFVFMFGTGISAALTGKRISWYQWIVDGITLLKDDSVDSWNFKKIYKHFMRVNRKRKIFFCCQCFYIGKQKHNGKCRTPDFTADRHEGRQTWGRH